jgi:glycosyltransferase involved in cell wall biosynthesis
MADPAASVDRDAPSGAAPRARASAPAVADDREPSPIRPLRTLVIVPAFNEEAALPAVLDELAEIVPDFTVVVVDDGSEDGTARVAQAHGATVLQLPFNLGIGGALRAGFRYAARHGYDRALQFDADGQHDASEISPLVAELDRGVDMVIGSRFADRTRDYQVGHVRAGAMSVLRFAIRQLAGRRFTDTSSGFRGFSRPMIEYFADYYPADYLETVEALLLACANGFRVEEVPVQMHQRQGGRPSNRHLRLLYHYVRVLLVLAVTGPGRRSSRPADHDRTDS